MNVFSLFLLTEKFYALYKQQINVSRWWFVEIILAILPELIKGVICFG